MFCYKYPHPAVTADCIVYNFTDGEMWVLLIKRGKDPYKGFWAFPGGFVNIDESAETAATRELQEETGISVEDISQLGAYSNPNRDPRERVITIVYMAEISDQVPVHGADDAVEAAWFSMNNLPTLAFDHLSILNDAIIEINRKISER